MAEYIDRNLIEWYGCDFEEPSCKNRECSGCSHAECSHSQVMQIPLADIIERSKIDKTIEEIKQEIQNGTIKITSGNEKLFNILGNIGE